MAAYEYDDLEAEFLSHPVRICWLAEDGLEVWVSPKPQQPDPATYSYWTNQQQAAGGLQDLLTLEMMQNVFNRLDQAALAQQQQNLWQQHLQNAAYHRGLQWLTWDLETPQTGRLTAQTPNIQEEP